MASTANYQSWVEVVPEFKGFNKAVEKTTTASLSSAADKGGRTLGSGILGAFGKLAKPLALVGATAAAGAGVAVGVAMTKGIDRALNIQDAQAKLTGLGHTTDTVTQIMGNALDSVRGTAFGLGDAASIAAGGVAAGIKPGKELTRVLKLTADAASIAGTDLGSMGSIFNKVAASGKLQGDVIAQLQDAGVPVLQFVAKEMGVTAGEAAKLASAGKVNFETFANAMETGLGGAALSSGKTFRGAFANMGAALGRFGAIFQTPIVAAAPAFFTGVTTAIDGLTATAGPLATAFGNRVGPALQKAGLGIAALAASGPEKVSGLLKDLRTFAQPVLDAFGRLKPVFAPLLPLFRDLFLAFSPLSLAFKSLAPSMPGLANGLASLAESLGGQLATTLTTLVPQMSALSNQMAQALAPAISDLLPTLGKAALDLIPSLGDALVKITPNIIDVVVALTPLVPLVADLVVNSLPPLIDLLNLLLTPTGETRDGMSGLAVAVGSVVSAITAITGFAPGGIQSISILGRVISGAISPTEFMAAGLRGDLGTAIQFVGNAAFITGQVVGTVFRAMVSTVASAVTQVQAAVASAFASLPAPVRAALSLMSGSVTSTLGGVQAKFASFGPRAASAVLGAGPALFNAGRSLITRLASGIMSGASRVISAASNVAKNAVRAATAGLGSGIRLPSFDFAAPGVPKLAQGGFVSKRPGGMPAVIGEGRYDEVVIPLSPKNLDRLSGGEQVAGKSSSVQVDVHAAPGMDAATVGRIAGETVNWQMRRA